MLSLIIAVYLFLRLTFKKTSSVFECEKFIDEFRFEGKWVHKSTIDLIKRA